MRFSDHEPLARDLVTAIHDGELGALEALLGEHPGLASARIVDGKGVSRTPLHTATDWPGYFPRAGGTPLDDAVGYGCWRVARLLVERGARVDRLWHAAALGLTSRVEELLRANQPTQQELTDAFWQACHGGQRRMAERLLALGADLNGTPSWGDDTPLDVAESVDTAREALVTWLTERGAEKSRRA